MLLHTGCMAEGRILLRQCCHDWKQYQLENMWIKLFTQNNPTILGWKAPVEIVLDLSWQLSYFSLRPSFFPSDCRGISMFALLVHRVQDIVWYSWSFGLISICLSSLSLAFSCSYPCTSRWWLGPASAPWPRRSFIMSAFLCWTQSTSAEWRRTMRRQCLFQWEICPSLMYAPWACAFFSMRCACETCMGLTHAPWAMHILQCETCMVLAHALWAKHIFSVRHARVLCMHFEHCSSPLCDQQSRHGLGCGRGKQHRCGQMMSIEYICFEV